MPIADLKKLSTILLMAIVIQACNLFKDEEKNSYTPPKATVSIDEIDVSIVLNQNITNFSIYINSRDATALFSKNDLIYQATLAELAGVLLDGNNRLQLYRDTEVFQVESFFIDVVPPIVYIDSVQCVQTPCANTEGTYQVEGGFIDDIYLDFLSFRRIQYHDNVSPPFSSRDSDGFPQSSMGKAEEGIFPLIDANNRFDFNTDIASAYELIAEDTAGNISQQYILANDAIINPALKIRMDNSLLHTLKTSFGDLLSRVDLTSIDNTAANYSHFLKVFSVIFLGDESEVASTVGNIQCSFNKPTNIFNSGDIQNTVADNCSWDGVEGSTTRLFIGSIAFDQVQLIELMIDEQVTDNLALNIDIIDTASNADPGLSIQLRAVAHQCKLKKVKVINPEDGKEYWITQEGIVCTETDQDGLFSLLYGSPELDGFQYASIEMEHFGADGQLAVKIVDQQLFVNFADDIQFSIGDFTAGGLPPSPLLDNIIAATIGNILQGIINQSLTEFFLPFTFTGVETGVAFDFVPQAFEVYSTLNKEEEASWFLYYTVLLQLDASSLDNANFPEPIPQILGSNFISTELPRPNKISNEDNLAISINGNFINQFLGILYRAGFFHLGLFNEQFYIGPGATNPLGKDGDTRVTLTPSAPATTLKSDDVSSNLDVQWPNILISESRKHDDSWKTKLQARANLNAKIAFDIVDQSLMIRLAEVKIKVLEFSIGKVDLGWFNTIVNIVINQILKQFAEETIVVTLPTITNSDDEKIDVQLESVQTAENGHLVLRLHVTKVAMPIP